MDNLKIFARNKDIQPLCMETFLNKNQGSPYKTKKAFPEDNTHNNGTTKFEWESPTLIKLNRP